MKAQDAINHIKAGGRAYVATQTRLTIIDAKCLAKFEAAGQWLLKDDIDGRGLRLRSGKGTVYLFEGQLKLEAL